MSASDVFISYSRNDAEFVRRLHDQLQAHEKSVIERVARATVTRELTPDERREYVGG